MLRRVFGYGLVVLVLVGLGWYWQKEMKLVQAQIAQIEQPYPQLMKWVKQASEEIRAEQEQEFQADFALIADYPGAHEALKYQPTKKELDKIVQINGVRLPDVQIAQIAKGEQLRIGFINDFQLGASGKVFPGKHVRVVKPKFLKRINYFIEQMHTSLKPHFMISPGDIIEGTNRNTPTGIAELRAIKYLFDSRSNIPMYWGLGNHALRSVTYKQFLQALDMESRRYSFIAGDYKIIVTGANYDESGRIPIPKHGYTRGNFAARELLWLEQELRFAQNDGLISVVFSHQPPLDNIEGRSDSGLPKGAKQVERLFADYKVALVFSGHIEKNFAKEVGGVKYFGTTGIKKSPNNLGTYAEIILSGREAKVNIYYIDNKTGEYIKEDLENYRE